MFQKAANGLIGPRGTSTTPLLADIEVPDELSPVPQLVAGVAFGSSNRTLENQLLELATAAEGLHRRLFPNERLMSRSKAERTASDASYAVPGDVRQLVRKRLAHLEEPSYRDRLNKLIERAGVSAGM